MSLATLMLLAVASCDSPQVHTPTTIVTPVPETATAHPVLLPTAMIPVASTPTPAHIAETPAYTPEFAPKPVAHIRTVVLDPGHGGPRTGGVAPAMNGQPELREKDVTLAIGLRAAVLLRAQGYRVILTRDSDIIPNADGRDLNGDGKVDNDDDLQARIDIANAANADIFLSIHSNANPSNTRVGGIETWYTAERPFSGQSLLLARALQSALLRYVRALGYNPNDRGAAPDDHLYQNEHLFVLGPANKKVARPSNMPGALGESLFLSNPTEAALLRQPATLDALAAAYADAVNTYFSQTKL